MITISKGDIVVEPIEFLIEFVFRALAKPYFHATPNTPIGQWGLAEWVWTAITAAIVLTMFFYSIRFFSNDAKVKKTKNDLKLGASASSYIVLWITLLLLTALFLLCLFLGMDLSARVATKDLVFIWGMCIILLMLLSYVLWCLKIKYFTPKK